MSLLRRNIVANVLGQSVGVLSGILLMPLYARFLGKEGFGLVGFFLSLQAIAAILDLGLAAAANREVSRLSAVQGEPGAGRHVVRTLEVLYAAMATLAFASLALSAGWIAGNWINAEELSRELVRDCVLIAAATIGVRLMETLYYGVLRGLERQVTMNLFSSGMIVGQTVALAAILVIVRPGVREFLLWQAGFVLVEFLALRRLAWRELQALGAVRPRFRPAVIRGIWRYALSVNGISLFAAGIKQVDKIVISKLMSIGTLGYYSAASLAANGIGKVAVPFQTALFPRFSALFAQQENDALGRLFRHSVRLLSLLSCSVAAAFAFFSWDILRVWMQSEEAASTAATPLSILASAMMFNGIMAPVFSLILATGYTQISLLMNAAGLAVLIPGTIYLVGAFGLAGAAMAWLGFNVAYYLIVPGWLARRWPHLSLRSFYLEDSAPFLVSSVGIVAVFSWLSAGMGPYARLGVAVAAGCACLGAGLALSAPLREMAMTTLGLRRQ
jgi:O-antigen/teichoic acid export membrane protein